MGMRAAMRDRYSQPNFSITFAALPFLSSIITYHFMHAVSGMSACPRRSSRRSTRA